MNETRICPICHSGASLITIPVNGGSGTALYCEECANAVPPRVQPERSPRKTPRPIATVRGELPGPGDVDPERAASVEATKERFLGRPRSPDKAVLQFISTYQEVFSAGGLRSCAPQMLKDFANSNIGCNPGNMSVFNREWHDVGDEEAAERVRDVVEFLLRGEGMALEDRFSGLVDGSAGVEMKGFREALLTKVLWVSDPDRFIPLVTYTGNPGKKEIAEAIWGVRLPAPDAVDWSLGRLSVWSNDLLRELSGDGFEDTRHVGEFLWWAKSQN